jgi:hypothetical protein
VTKIREQPNFQKSPGLLSKCERSGFFESANVESTVAEVTVVGGMKCEIRSLWEHLSERSRGFSSEIDRVQLISQQPR